MDSRFYYKGKTYIFAKRCSRRAGTHAAEGVIVTSHFHARPFLAGPEPYFIEKKILFKFVKVFVLLFQSIILSSSTTRIYLRARSFT